MLAMPHTLPASHGLPRDGQAARPIEVPLQQRADLFRGEAHEALEVIEIGLLR
jgi:hypothetical protein